MPIITQLNATKLRSLKYGNDTSDGGNSGQPYMKVSLKDVDKGFTKLRLTKFDDGLIRGGAIGALNASVVDTLRIGKFLTDLPKGPLFLVKQVGLQLSNPKLEAKKGISGFLSEVGSTRLYNLGINTLAQVPLNAFGGHLMRHGLMPTMNDDIKYLNVVSENNKWGEDNLGSQNNRLVGLRNKFNLGDNETEVSNQFNLKQARRTNRINNRQERQNNREANRKGRENNRLVNQSTKEGAKTEGFDFVRSKFHRTKFTRNKLDTTTLTIDSYTGGPNSVYGIGRTIINRYNFTEDKIKVDEAYDNARVATVIGSLSINPLTEASKYINASGSYVTGSITTPITNWTEQWANNKEDNQFSALARKRQPNDFLYNGHIPESVLQKGVGNGKIEVYPHSKPPSGSSFENKYWNAFHNPVINPVTSTPSDKFKVIKSQEEDTDYTKSKRIVTFEDDTKGTFTVIQNGDAPTGTQTFTGKTQAEAEAKLSDWNTVSHNLDEVVVTSGKPKITNTVKAHIINVKGFEGDLEDAYQSGLMVDSSKTKIYQNNFVTDEISIDRDPKYKNTGKPSFKYFSGNKKITNFERIDSDIMVVEFDPIDPFSAKDLRNVQFSAYMSGFKYNSNSTWNPIKYVGRAESFYTFTEHKRDVSFNLQIPCFNRTHILEKHRALSELQSIGAGTYNTSNRLGGIITQVTVGNYLVKQPGILTSVSFDIPDTSSWDIDLELAMYINAQFNFTIIGDSLPEYQEGGFLSHLPNPIVGTGYLTGANAR